MWGDMDCPEVHEEVNMLKELIEPAYFFKSYVDKKAGEYQYPRICAICEECLVIEGRYDSRL